MFFDDDFSKKVWKAFIEGLPLLVVYILVPVLLVLIMYYIDKLF